jgi:acetyltransferase-like isoleucine patch superfamily enzyme
MGIPFVQMAIIGMMPSPLKVAYYRARGARIGKGVRIGMFSVLAAEQIEIGDGSRIGMLSFIKAKKLRLGNRVRIGTMVAMDTAEISIGHDSVVMEQTVVGGMLTPRSSLYVGSRVKIFPYCFLNPTEPIVIEDDVGVGGSTYLFTHGSWQSVLEGFPIGFGPIHLRRGVWLPWRIFILPNVEVGEQATIGAGSVINRSIPARALAAGMPAKVISEDGKYLKPMSEEDRWRKVISILEEMGQFLSFQGQVSTVTGGDDRYVLITAAGKLGVSFAIEIARHGTVTEEVAAVFVSLGEIPAEIRRKLEERGSAWFDIAARQTSLGLHPAVDHVRNFFSRYGIRFAVASDPVFGP